jgi:predicted extracellular nuclease
MKNFYILFVFFYSLPLISKAQTSIHFWDFNSGSVATANAAWASPIAATSSLNSGSLTFNFTATEDFAGSTLDAAGFPAVTAGLSFDPIGLANNNNSFILNASTSGFQNIVLTYATRGTSTGFANHIVDYSTDGINYINFTTITGRTSTTFSLQTINFSAITAANNNPNFKVRVIVNGATDANGNNRFDNIRIAGIAAGNTVAVSAGANTSEPSTSGSFAVTFTPATPGSATFDYALTGTGTFNTDYSVTLSGSATPSPLVASTGTITVPTATTTVTITITPIDDPTVEGTETIILTLSNPTGGYTLGTASANITLADDDAVGTPLHTIQGSGSAATAGSFTADAIVTGIYPTLSPAGFYIQEEDADADADPNTSEGIFVVSATAVAVGDRVRVAGTVQEDAVTPSFNQAVFATATVTILSNGNPLPTTVDITLPVAATTDYEKYEGMRVRFPGTLTVTDNDNLGSFGELKLSAGGLVYQPTQVVDPNDNPASGTTSTGASNVAAVNALIASNSLRTILLDDGRGTIPTLPYVNVDNTVRVGSTINNITGILGYAFSQYRIQPIAAAVPSFTYAARPAVPIVGGNLKIASFNVLNYFNGNGAGGGFPTSRGAHSLAEFNRQRDKIINAISQINADVVGLIEIENLDLNDATPALLDLVNGLNAVMGAGTYSLIDDDLDNSGAQDNNTDQIRCAIIYKSAVVTPVGAALLNSNGATNRPNLAQTFNLTATNKNFNFIVNHFKSKGGTGTGLDADQGDGQAAFNETRRQQATNLLTFINGTLIPTSGTNRVISVGDYNAYYEEDPMDILRAGGYSVTSTASSYSYLFGGQVGSLDHAVLSSSLTGTLTGVEKWNANGIEPSYLDYNDIINDGGSDVVNPWGGTYTVSPWRASDHDPVVMGLLLDVTLPVTITKFSVTKENTTSKISWTTAQEINSREFIVERSTDGGRNWLPIATVAANGNSNSPIHYSIIDATPFKGNNLYRLKSVDIDNKFGYSAIRSVNFESKYTFRVYPNPAKEVLQITTDDAGGFNGIIQVLNTQGQLMINKSINSNNQLLSVNIESLSSGMYVLKITTADGTVKWEKFIKE